MAHKAAFAIWPQEHELASKLPNAFIFHQIEPVVRKSLSMLLCNTHIDVKMFEESLNTRGGVLSIFESVPLFLFLDAGTMLCMFSCHEHSASRSVGRLRRARKSMHNMGT